MTTTRNETLPYYKMIREKFEKNASTAERDFVAQVDNINQVLAEAIKEMIVLGLDLNGVKEKINQVTRL